MSTTGYIKSPVSQVKINAPFLWNNRIYYSLHRVQYGVMARGSFCHETFLGANAIVKVAVHNVEGV